MQLRATLVALAVSVMAGHLPASAQKPSVPLPPPERHFRVGIGLIAGTSGLGAGLDVSMNTERRLYRGRLTAQDNTVGGGMLVDRHSVFETAFMLGRGRRFTRNYGSVAGGLALVTVESREDGSEASEDRTTIGVPLEAQLISGGPLRLGATLAANLNVHRPFAALVMSIQLGRVP